MIALEIQAIGALNEMAVFDAGPTDRSGVRSFRKARCSSTPTRFSQVRRQLQDWLLDASTVDLTRYSRHLMDLALLREQHAGKSFNDGIARAARIYPEGLARADDKGSSSKPPCRAWKTLKSAAPAL